MSKRLLKFLSYYRPFTRLLVIDLTCAVIVAATAVALPLYVRRITQIVLAGDGLDSRVADIGQIGLLMMLLIAIATLCEAFVNYRGHMIGTLIEARVRADLFDHLQRLPYSFYDENRTGALMSRMTNDLENLGEFCHHGPEDAVIGLLKLLGAAAVLFAIDVPLSAILFLALPLLAVYAVSAFVRLDRVMHASRERIGDVNAQVEDTLAGIRVVQSFVNEALEKMKFDRANRAFVDSRRAVFRQELFFYDVLVLAGHMMTAIVALFGGLAVVRAQMSVSDLLTYLLYAGLIIDPVQRAANFARWYQAGVTGFNRVMDIIERPAEIQNCDGAIDIRRARGEIVFDRVSFKYHDDQIAVVRDISLQIAAGEYVALVGPSGAGKSTLCALIPRFYDATAGVVRLDGVDVREISLRSLRANIGVVQQDVYLFSGSVAENIRYGRPDASDDEIVDAARQANAHDFILSLPQGYATDVGQRGVKLSGGQKQRIAVARVFLKDPPVLLMDEATSALDALSERAVQESLERLARRRTTLVIAHRLSTIRNADRILVLTEAGIVEQGTHAVLLAQGGVYARLYEAQIAAV